MDLSDLSSLSVEEKLELLKLLEIRDRRLRENWLEQYKPYAKQREFHEKGAEFRERLFLAGNQLGKELRFDEPVLTPTGWVRICDLHVGDEVIAGDGTVTTVTGVFPQGVKPLVEIQFCYGQTVIAGYDHQWKVQTPATRFRTQCRTLPGRNALGKRTSVQEPNPAHGEWSVVTTRQIIDKYGYTPGPRNRHATPAPGPAQLQSRPVSIDPYVLGMLIGDGGLTGTVMLSTGDAPMVEAFAAEVARFGGRVARSSSRPHDYRAAYAPKLTAELARMGLKGVGSYKKFVPQEYLWNSPEVRLAVLQGLMDTDGTCEKRGLTSFCTTSAQLCDDLVFLVQSLGGKCKVAHKHPRFSHKGVTKTGHVAYIVTVRLPHVPVFRLERKLARYIRPTSTTDHNLMVSFKPVEAAPAWCISVAHPDRTYITRDFIVTHNTYSGAAEVAYHATGRYPKDWKGRKFPRPVSILAGSESAELTRKGVQRLLLGPPQKREEWGTGAIPKDCIVSTSMKSGVPDAVSSIVVKNEYGGESVIQLNSYDQGRMQHVDSRVLTPTGWKRIGDIKLLDEVISVDGSPTRVMGVFPHGVKDLYELTFDSGVKTLAGAEHLWTVGERTRGAWKTVSTADLIKRYGDAGERISTNWQVTTPHVEPVQFPPRPVPLDPYLVGALLGDGCVRGGRVRFTSKDDDIIAEVGAAGFEVGAEIAQWSEIQFGFRNSDAIRDSLDALGLNGVGALDKRVPEVYLWNGPSVRFSVLQGLMDTDGSVSIKGSMTFATTSSGLAEDVAFLVRSLGGKATVRSKGAKGRVNELFQVSVKLPGPPPFRLRRKLQRCRRPETETHRHILRTIRKVAPGEAVCIAVEHPSHLYVTDDFIVTHNTKWQADTVDLVWFDEEPPEDIYFEGLTRTNATGGIVFVTFTPLLGMSAVVKRYLVEKAAGTGVTQMTIEDAEHYTPEERAKIVASYPEHEREARARGIPILGSGMVFPVAESMIKVEPFAIPPHWGRLNALDFGIDHPAAFVALAHDRDTDTVYVYDAWRTKGAQAIQAGLTPIAHQVALINGKGYQHIPAAWPHDGLQRDKVSGVQLKEEYKKHGVNMLPERATFEDGTNGVEAGLSQMLDRFQTRRLRVFSHLNEWFEELRLYHRKDGLVVKIDDDLMSATRYGVMMLRYAKSLAELEPVKARRLGRAPTIQPFQIFNSDAGY